MTEFRGTLKCATKDLKSGKYLLTFEVDRRPEDFAEDLAINVKPYRNHRSLSANAYHWVLVSKMAEKLGISNSVMHNLQIRGYGQPARYDGDVVCVIVPDTDRAEKEVLMKEFYHLKPTAKTVMGKNGDPFRVYILMRGSHEYDTAEMARLIDGDITEAKEMGIETLSPEEIERMMADYEKHYAKQS